MRALYVSSGKTEPTKLQLEEAKIAAEVAWLPDGDESVDSSNGTSAPRGASLGISRSGKSSRRRGMTTSASRARKEYFPHEGPDPLVPSVYDRPDLVARAFQGRLNALLDIITKLGVLGRVRALTFNMEWQMRGALRSSFFSVR